MKDDQPQAIVVGYGYAGRAFHSYLIGLNSGIALRGIVARREEVRQQAATERGCDTFATLEEALKLPEVDLVVLATPTDTHAPLAIQALKAGKHVVVDKPLCLTLAECDAMIAAARDNDVTIHPFQNRRWDGDYLTLRNLLESGQLGELRWLEMAWQNFRMWGGWRGQMERGGGMFYDLGAHLLDQTLLLMGSDPVRVFCRLHYDWNERDIPSHSMMIVEFANGATGVVDTGGMYALTKPRMAAFGSKGAFIKHGLDPQEEAMKRGAIDEAREDPANYGTYSNGEEERVVPTLPGRWRNFYESVADQLTGKDLRSRPVKIAEVRRVMQIFDAARQSAAENRVVEL